MIESVAFQTNFQRPVQTTPPGAVALMDASMADGSSRTSPQFSSCTYQAAMMSGVNSRWNYARTFERHVAEGQHAQRRQFAANWKWLRPSAYLEIPRYSDSASFCR
jgi:hypothetical protein